MSEFLYAYKPGNNGIETILKNGVCVYGSGQTTQDFINQGCEILPVKELHERINSVLDSMCGKYLPIDGDQYNLGLGCLPPERWENCDGVSIFRLGECITGNVYKHYISYRGYYFTVLQRKIADYWKIAADVKNLPCYIESLYCTNPQGWNDPQWNKKYNGEFDELESCISACELLASDKGWQKFTMRIKNSDGVLLGNKVYGGVK